jgi:putative acetyltransferase
MNLGRWAEYEGRTVILRGYGESGYSQISGMPTIAIDAVSSDTQLSATRELFLEYAQSLPFDLGFQDFDQEIETLPGGYAAPRGALLLATIDGEIAGCVALRRFDEESCELKRLYVRQPFRGRGAGKKLVDAIIRTARLLGYKRMLLDTVESMKEAIALYAGFGFIEIPPYRHNPIRGARFFERSL